MGRSIAARPIGSMNQANALSANSITLDPRQKHSHINHAHFGGVLVSTNKTRQRRHAEDDPLASLIIGSKK